MSVFQSIGSNYLAGDVWYHLTSWGSAKDSQGLQTDLSDSFDGKDTVLFHTGRAALSAGVRATTGGTGAVLVNAFTCSVVVDAVRSAGCDVVYVDIERDSLHYSAKSAEEAIASRSDVRAMIIQNSLGIPVDIAAFEKVAERQSIPIIEDVAHAVGGSYADGRRIGTVGSMTAVSFGRDKVLDTINGGALVVREEALSQLVERPTKLPRRIDQFRDRIYPLIALLARGLFSIKLGGVFLRLVYMTGLAARSADGGVHTDVTMPHWQAKCGVKQLRRLPDIIDERNSVSQRYKDLQALLPKRSSSTAIRIPVYARNRDEVVAALKNEGFYLEDIWYDVPVAPKRLYDSQDFPENENPQAVEVCAQILNLPTHRLVAERDARQMVKIIKETAKLWK